MSAAELTDQITDIVSRVILESSGRILRPAPEDRLIEKGYLDSLSMVNLVLALQLDLGVQLEINDLNEETFGSVAAITRLVEARR
jgi:acyl carrier protein